MDYRYCRLCGTTKNIERHHVFYGPNRKNSEKYKMVMDLCHEHHTGNTGIHFNRKMDLSYKRLFQKEFEKEYSHEKFMEVFGRNYLTDELRPKDYKAV